MNNIFHIKCIVLLNVRLCPQEEFAEALAMKPDSVFVNQMFSVIDHDRNGYLSFRELLYAVVLFLKGNITCTTLIAKSVRKPELFQSPPWDPDDANNCILIVGALLLLINSLSL